MTAAILTLGLQEAETEEMKLRESKLVAVCCAFVTANSKVYARFW